MYVRGREVRFASSTDEGAEQLPFVGGRKLWREGADLENTRPETRSLTQNWNQNEVSPEEGVKREMINSGLTRGLERGKKDKSAKFTALLHHVTP
jgi:hypothetical protein